jgi:hypothetical protein
MASKKFKTVAGYLRSADDELHCGALRNIEGEARIAATKTGQRNIINGLLPQLGLPKLSNDEEPREGIKRLIAIGGTEQQVKALKAVERWLKNYIIVISSTVTGIVTDGPAPRRGGTSSYRSGAVGVTTPDDNDLGDAS